MLITGNLSPWLEDVRRTIKSQISRISLLASLGLSLSLSLGLSLGLCLRLVITFLLVHKLRQACNQIEKDSHGKCIGEKCHST